MLLHRPFTWPQEGWTSPLRVRESIQKCNVPLTMITGWNIPALHCAVLKGHVRLRQHHSQLNQHSQDDMNHSNTPRWEDLSFECYHSDLIGQQYSQGLVFSQDQKEFSDHPFSCQTTSMCYPNSWREAQAHRETLSFNQPQCVPFLWGPVSPPIIGVTHSLISL